MRQVFGDASELRSPHLSGALSHCGCRSSGVGRGQPFLPNHHPLLCPLHLGPSAPTFTPPSPLSFPSLCPPLSLPSLHPPFPLCPWGSCAHGESCPWASVLTGDPLLMGPCAHGPCFHGGLMCLSSLFGECGFVFCSDFNTPGCLTWGWGGMCPTPVPICSPTSLRCPSVPGLRS